MHQRAGPQGPEEPPIVPRTRRVLPLDPELESSASTLVAHGELDVACASGSSHDWDLAGADLLVHEAGGALTNFMGRSLTYNQPELVHGALVAAGADRHAALVVLTREWLAEIG